MNLSFRYVINLVSLFPDEILPDGVRVSDLKLQSKKKRQKGIMILVLFLAAAFCIVVSSFFFGASLVESFALFFFLVLAIFVSFVNDLLFSVPRSDRLVYGTVEWLEELKATLSSSGVDSFRDLESLKVKARFILMGKALRIDGLYRSENCLVESKQYLGAKDEFRKLYKLFEYFNLVSGGYGQFFPALELRRSAS